MRRGGRILILLGILLGMIAAGGTFLVLSTQQAPAPAVPTRSVVVALQSIPARSDVTQAAVGKRDYPENVIPPGAYERSEDVTGKLAIQTIFPGQIILPQMLNDRTSTKDIRSNASFLIPEGKVAVEYPITPLSGVGGALQPGDYVDILLTLNPNQIQTTAGRPISGTVPGTEGLAVTQIMLQDVLILQVGQWGLPATGNQQTAQASIITFVLERQDALALKSAREQGSIDLALRRAGDHIKIPPTSIEPVNLEYLNRRFNFRLTPVR